jgi:hypothetical protein
MTYPKIMTQIFDEEGGGSKIKEAILPTVAIKATSQSLTDSQKSQARTNIDAQSANELKTALSELITSYGGTVPN